MFYRVLAFTILLGGAIGLLFPRGNLPAPAPAVEDVSPLVVSAAASQPRSESGVTEVVLERKYDGHFYADALVNGQPVRFLVDTGASGVALTSEDARRIGLQFQPSDFGVIGSGASGDVLGKPVTLNAVTIGPKEMRDVRGVIVADGLRVSLLGQSFLSRLNSVQMTGDRMTLH